VTKAAKELFREALDLAPGERAELAAELIASLDGEPDADADAAWAAEIDRRAADAKTGADPGRSWPEVRDQVKTRLGKP
jgi:putative addiction module component (TIGR02574 family)